MSIIAKKLAQLCVVVSKTAVVTVAAVLLSTSFVTAARAATKPVEKAPALQDFTGKNCWLESAKLYRLDPYLLFAIAMVESGLNPAAFNGNTNGSYDTGMMQINSYWFPTLKKHGIEKHHLSDPCVSIQVGAWVLAWNFHKLGNSWKAIGAYNAVSHDKRVIYANKVYAMYDRLKLWSAAYRESYINQFGTEPAYTPKPPVEWLKFDISKVVNRPSQQLQ